MSLMSKPPGKPKGWKLLGQQSPAEKKPEWTPIPKESVMEEIKAAPETPLQVGTVAPEGGITLTFEQLQTLLANVVEKFKEPSAEEKLKLETEKALFERRRTEMVRIAREETARMAASQAACPHLKENGKPCTGGQMFSDGYIRMFCLRCGKIVQEYQPSQLGSADGFGNISDEFRGTGAPEPIM